MNKSVVLLTMLMWWPSYIWAIQKTFGNGDNEYANYSIETSDGGYLIVGYTNGVNTSGDDALIVKLDKFGVIEWSKVINNTGNDRFYGCCEINSSYCVVGYTTAGSHGGTDAWCIRFTLNGDVIWSRLLGEQKDDGFLKLMKLSTSTIALCGYSGGVGQQFAYLYLAKLDLKGNTIWEHKYGSGITSTQTNTARQLCLDTKGNIIISGYTYCFGAGQHDGMLVAIDSATGNRIWTKTYGGAQNDGLDNIFNTIDGYFVTSGAGRIDGSSFAKFWVLKVTSNGDTLWQKSYFLDDDVSSSGSLNRAEDDGFIAILNQANTANPFCMIMRLKKDGSSVWCKIFDGAMSESFANVFTTYDQQYVAIGSTNSFGTGSLDLYFVKMDKNGEFDSCCIQSTLVKSHGKPPKIVLQTQNTIAVSTAEKLAPNLVSIILNSTLHCNPKPQKKVQYDTICLGQSYRLPNGDTTHTAGTYNTIFAKDGCDSVVVTNLSFRKIPETNLRDTFLCELEFDTIWMKSNPFLSYLWMPSRVTDSEVKIFKPGKHSMTFTNFDGCVYTKNFEVFTNCAPALHVPNAFTPNRDHLNETFLPMGISMKEYQLDVYNRWGEKIFSTTSTETGWDGTYKELNCPQGVYVYVIWAVGIDNLKYKRKGTVTLLR